MEAGRISKFALMESKWKQECPHHRVGKSGWGLSRGRRRLDVAIG